jgi:hypothetical protein
MNTNFYQTVMSNLDRKARLSGEGDSVNYPMRCGAAEALLMIALSHVAAHHGNEAARKLMGDLGFVEVDHPEEEKV